MSLLSIIGQVTVILRWFGTDLVPNRQAISYINTKEMAWEICRNTEQCVNIFWAWLIIYPRKFLLQINACFFMVDKK